MSDDYSLLFRSTDDQISPLDAQVTGNIPEWLNGTLMRLGPGKFDLKEDFTLNHWFDGFAVAYKFDIKDGKVQFKKRILQSDAYKKAMSIGRPVFTEFGTRAYPDPCKNIFSRMVSTVVPDLTDNTGQAFVAYEDSLYATTESGALRKISTDSLEVGEKVDLTKVVGVNLASSHYYKSTDGSIYTLGTSLITGFKYHLIKLPPSSNNKTDPFKKASIVATIPSRWKSCVAYYHSFGMTDKYIVFIEQPLQVNGMKLISCQIKGKSMRDCIEWVPEEQNYFHVVEIATGKTLPIKYRSEKPFCVFHHINTYEEDGQLIVDLIAQDSAEIMDKMFLKHLRRCDFDLRDKSHGRRFILPLADSIKSFEEGKNLVKSSNTGLKAVKVGDTVVITGQNITEPGYELPTINPQYFGKKYKYYYASGMFDVTRFRNAIVKVEADTGEALVWRDSTNSYPGEVQFVSRPGANGEDDGVLLTGVTDLRPGHSDYLLVLDARTLTELARAEVSAHVPNLLHGIFIPS